jgi:hypothetical protein
MSRRHHPKYPQHSQEGGSRDSIREYVHPWQEPWRKEKSEEDSAASEHYPSVPEPLQDIFPDGLFDEWLSANDSAAKAGIGWKETRISGRSFLAPSSTHNRNSTSQALISACDFKVVGRLFAISVLSFATAVRRSRTGPPGLHHISSSVCR